MKLLSTLFFTLLTSTLFAQKKIELRSLKTEMGYEIVATNFEIFPVSIEFNFNLKNLAPVSNINLFVIPANAKNYKITTLNIVEEGKAYQFSYQYFSAIGDITLTKYDTNFVYELPFKTGNSFRLYQGYNGDFSHQNENALDFTMPIGTSVVAARAGLVIAVVDENDKSCSNKSCIQYNNYITILHNDGTYAKYVHIDNLGARVKVGDEVKIGDVIAMSGNIGFSSGPHLHFECCLPSIEGKHTIETFFKVNDGNKVEKLQEKEIYTKNY